MCPSEISRVVERIDDRLRLNIGSWHEFTFNLVLTPFVLGDFLFPHSLGKHQHSVMDRRIGIGRLAR